MSDYIRRLDRQQQLLFPDRLEDYVGGNNPVRAIDTYVDSLDVDALGFKTRYSDKHNNGRPAFCPKLMVKLTIYGYTHKIKVSRNLTLSFCNTEYQLTGSCAPRVAASTSPTTKIHMETRTRSSMAETINPLFNQY